MREMSKAESLGWYIFAGILLLAAAYLMTSNLDPKLADRWLFWGDRVLSGFWMVYFSYLGVAEWIKVFRGLTKQQRLAQIDGGKFQRALSSSLFLLVLYQGVLAYMFYEFLFVRESETFLLWCALFSLWMLVFWAIFRKLGAWIKSVAFGRD